MTVWYLASWHATDEPEWNGGFWPALLWLTAAAALGLRGTIATVTL